MSDDDRPVDPQWKAIVEECIIRPAFYEAWQEVGEAGVASESAVDLCFRMIQESDYHKRRLANSVEEIHAAALVWADRLWAVADEQDVQAMHVVDEQFLSEVFSRVMTHAALFLLIGGIVGVGSTRGVTPDRDD